MTDASLTMRAAFEADLASIVELLADDERRRGRAVDVEHGADRAGVRLDRRARLVGEDSGHRGDDEAGNGENGCSHKAGDEQPHRHGAEPGVRSSKA